MWSGKRSRRGRMRRVARTKRFAKGKTLMPDGSTPPEQIKEQRGPRKAVRLCGEWHAMDDIRYFAATVAAKETGEYWSAGYVERRVF